MLFDKDINPLAPYDSAIPQLINDTRYAALPNIADRQATFDEYCLEKSRAARAAKQSKESSNAAPVDEKVKTREAYEGLLRDELKSTRTSWDDFRKKWKKDRRFFGFGRDDKEREKVFKEWRNSLGERELSTLLQRFDLVDMVAISRETKGSAESGGGLLQPAERAR